MDLLILNFVNQTLAGPLLDGVMVGLTTVGLAALPALGLGLALRRGQRRTGVAILVSLLAGFCLTVIFQYLALRPRPENVRLLLPQPGFPSFPSGHAAAAFGVALVLGLTYRQGRWWAVGLAAAGLIGLSRVYLGHHFPSDVAGGAVLGAAVGAACFGLLGTARPAWRWLLWPQVAVVLVVTQMAYLDLLPRYLLRWPLADKVIHFLLFGAVVFWLNFWLQGRRLHWRGWAIPVAILLPFTLALLEEGVQHFSPLRSADLGDLASDLMGMLFFWVVSDRFVVRANPPEAAD